MDNLLGQVSYPVFVSGIFVFFIIASIFSFIVGVGLALRSPRMLRFFEFMNRGFSTRKLLKPLARPHFVEPTLLKHPRILGVAIIAGAITSVVMLKEIDALAFQPMYEGMFDDLTAEILSEYTHTFLLLGNALCIVVGILMMYFPRHLSLIEGYTDKWYTFRKQTRPLYVTRIEVDKWVLAHPTVSGVTLSVMSLVLGLSMYVRL
ncbi:MAG: hypothetical protein KJ795_09105 [Gammaproteobacteria bacterium]|nr:hypothetical protein [Gammaproteobacteria bacterium]MBU1777213.1 hypothetical protein [Gammaproteobacteria bacterium]MBU1970148.1 hypothetical protein [Gammaproteobacteria bacterium]